MVRRWRRVHREILLRFLRRWVFARSAQHHTHNNKPVRLRWTEEHLCKWPDLFSTTLKYHASCRESLPTAICLINMLPYSVLGMSTLLFKLFGKHADLSHLRARRARAFVHNERCTDTLEDKAWEERLVGYGDDSKTYSIYNMLLSGFQTLNVTFIEKPGYVTPPTDNNGDDDDNNCIRNYSSQDLSVIDSLLQEDNNSGHNNKDQVISGPPVKWNLRSKGLPPASDSTATDATSNWTLQQLCTYSRNSSPERALHSHLQQDAEYMAAVGIDNNVAPWAIPVPNSSMPSPHRDARDTRTPSRKSSKVCKIIKWRTASRFFPSLVTPASSDRAACTR